MTAISLHLLGAFEFTVAYGVSSFMVQG